MFLTQRQHPFPHSFRIVLYPLALRNFNYTRIQQAMAERNAESSDFFKLLNVLQSFFGILPLMHHYVT